MKISENPLAQKFVDKAESDVGLVLTITEASDLANLFESSLSASLTSLQDKQKEKEDALRAETPTTQMQPNEETGIASCPFCGAGADCSEYEFPRNSGNKTLVVFCENVDDCGAEIEECVGPGATYSLKEVIARWNRRVPQIPNGSHEANASGVEREAQSGASGNARETTEKEETAGRNYCVIGDHPVLARPDRFGLTLIEATDYADQLRKSGFDNVMVRGYARETTKEEL